MEKIFEKQLNNNNPLTEEVLQKFHIKKYFNGEEIQVGEIVLFAMLESELIEKEGEMPYLPLTLITLNERHFDLFEYKFNQSMSIPVISFKKSL